MKFNKQQSDAITVRNHAIVSAGAGSGKTAVIVERFLSLLTQSGIENILCLTFTRKAAGEMYRRIYRRLSQAAEPELQREFLRFDKARITTIDSFCSNIIRPYLAEYGYPVDFSINEEEFRQDLETFTLSYLSAPRCNAVITRLLEQFSYNDIINKLFLGLANEFVGLNHLSEQHGEKFFYLLEAALEQELDYFRAAIPQIHEVNRAETRNDQNRAHHREAMEQLEGALPEIAAQESPLPPEAADQTIGLINRIIPALHTLAAGRTARKPWKVFRDLYDRLKDICLPSLIILTERDFYHKFYALVTDYLGAVLEFRRKKGILYFRDLLELAVQILRDHPGLADYYRGEIHYIMIDEFQDNNNLQKELLFLLSASAGTAAETGTEVAGRGGLFFVGDQKQSIYRFRGADVSVFKRLGAELQAGGNGDSGSSGSSILSLTTNYRSSPILIDFFNAFFPRIMGGGEDFEADYEALEAGLEQQLPSHIELILIPDTADAKDDTLLSSQEMEAYSIAKRIHEICGEQKLHKQVGDTTQPITYGDIAILFRSSTIQYLIEKMLRRFAIPFTSDSTRSLFIDAPAFDTHAFLKLCLFPEDRFSLAALLRSPICRMGDDAIAALLRELSQDRLADGVRLSTAAPAALALSPEDIGKYNDLLGLCEEIRPLIGHYSHIEVLGEIWKRSGYLDFITSDPQRLAWLQHYDYLAEFFDLHARRPMVELLEIMEENLGQFRKIDDIGIFQEDGESVRIMTVHKAKGLEFPIVFLVNCNQRPRNPTEASASWVRAKGGELILYGGLSTSLINKYLPDNEQAVKDFRNPLVRQAEGYEKQQENAEGRRLLYVAFTRAEQHLFITAAGIRIKKQGSGGQLKGKESGNMSSASAEQRENFFDLIKGGLGMDPTEALSAGEPYYREVQTQAGRIFLSVPAPVREAELAPLASIEKLKEISGPPPALVIPAVPKTHFAVTELQAFQYKAEGKAPKDGQGAEKKTAEFGLLLHHLLEKTAKHAARTGETRIPPAPAALLSQLEETEREEAAELAESFVRTPLFQDILQADEIQCEFPFVLYLEPCFIHGQIDLIIHRDNKTLIVDYKSGGDPDPSDYRVQLDVYRLALEALGCPQIETGIYDLRRQELFIVGQQFGKEHIAELAQEVGRLSGRQIDRPPGGQAGGRYQMR